MWEPIDSLDPDYQDYSYVWNGIWLVVVTMTSGRFCGFIINIVGFGDYYPRSHLGRLVIILTTFWGVFLISMCIVSVSNYRKFYSTEKYVRKKTDFLKNKMFCYRLLRSYIG
jgi:hypothetical protein